MVYTFAGQVNESGYVLGHSPCDTTRPSVSNIQIIEAFEGPANFRTNTEGVHARIRFTHIFPIHR